jgi:hypothetical protein
MVVHFTRGSAPTPGRFRLFGRLATIRPIRKARPSLTTCSTCFRYHSTSRSTCQKPPRCGQCSQGHHAQPEPCSLPARCINCRGPHIATSSDCPARPQVVQGTIRRPDRRQLQAIRAAGTRAWRVLNSLNQSQASASDSEAPAYLSSSSDQTNSIAGARITSLSSESETDSPATALVSPSGPEPNPPLPHETAPRT